MRKINISSDAQEIKKLKAGEQILLSGIIYTARDQAHKRLFEAINKNKKMPIGLKGRIIYYCGPTPQSKGKIIGSCGPTTSSRMDEFTPALLKKGVLAMIGKGRRSTGIVKAIKRHKAVYFLTYSGCGALLAKYVQKNEPVAYKDLGPEAIYRLEVRDFPLIVGIDTRGRSIYD